MVFLPHTQLGKLLVLSVLALAVFVLRTGAETGPWPEHVLCDTPHVRLAYTSCDPFQDIGFTLNECPVHLKLKTNSKISLLLRHSIEELYLSVDFGVVYHETLCLPNMQRFSFCGRRRGELVNEDWPWERTILPLKGHYKLQARLVNQEADLIACANVTLNFK